MNQQSELNPEQAHLAKSAFTALEEFAKRNFPRNKPFRRMPLCALDSGFNRLYLAGGIIFKLTESRNVLFESGVWLFTGDSIEIVEFPWKKTTMIEKVEEVLELFKGDWLQFYKEINNMMEIQ